MKPKNGESNHGPFYAPFKFVSWLVIGCDVGFDDITTLFAHDEFELSVNSMLNHFITAFEASTIKMWIEDQLADYLTSDKR
jgi:hypothetical protein